MNALAAESDAEVPQVLRACSAPFPASLLTVSMENQYPPSVVLGVGGVEGGGHHSAEPELNWVVKSLLRILNRTSNLPYHFN